MDLEIDDNYFVEHGDNFVLNEEQLRKLIDAKFARNLQYVRSLKQQEDQLYAD